MIYRAVTLLATRSGVDGADRRKVAGMLARIVRRARVTDEFTLEAENEEEVMFILLLM